MDETGTVLLDEGVGYHFHGQEKCVSSLTVRQQSGDNRKYTCRFEQHSGTKIQSDYTPDFLGGNQTEISNPGKRKCSPPDTKSLHIGFSNI